MCRALPLVLCFLTGCSAIRNNTDTTFEWLMDMYNPFRFDNFSDMSLTGSCQNDMQTYLDALLREELWAVQSKLKVVNGLRVGVG